MTRRSHKPASDTHYAHFDSHKGVRNDPLPFCSMKVRFVCSFSNRIKCSLFMASFASAVISKPFPAQFNASFCSMRLHRLNKTASTSPCAHVSTCPYVCKAQYCFEQSTVQLTPHSKAIQKPPKWELSYPSSSLITLTQKLWKINKKSQNKQKISNKISKINGYGSN